MPYEILIHVEGESTPLKKTAKNKDEIIQILGAHISATTGDGVQIVRK